MYTALYGKNENVQLLAIIYLIKELFINPIVIVLIKFVFQKKKKKKERKKERNGIIFKMRDYKLDPFLLGQYIMFLFSFFL
jgi:hypothetical protein